MGALRQAGAVAAGLLVWGAALAGGPLAVRTNGQPFVWSTAEAIQYRTDDGPLSPTVSQSQAQARVRNMFDVWQDVASASIRYTRAGFISDTPGFSDGDVSTAAEFNAVEGDCANGDQNPVIYDANGDIFDAVIGDDSVIGFAGPCAIDVSQGRITSGQAVMNGLYQDGIDNANNSELTAAEFNGAFVHEFGHFSGLAHTQVNVECLFGCGTDSLAGLPTMFPFLVADQQGTLSIDDIGWISKLYPAGGGSGFAATHGTVTGTVYFSDGESHAKYVNVIARRVDSPGTGPDESLTRAASCVSGNKFRDFLGNPITEPDPQPLGPFGSDNPAHIGFYEIPLPPGNYMIEVESIHPELADKGVGGDNFIPMPGSAPAPLGPVTVTAGATSAGHDIVLIGTPPRFDAFEGP